MWSCSDGQHCPGSVSAVSLHSCWVFFAVFQKKHYVLLILCALGLPLPSYTCIRQVAIQVELVRACSEAGACDSVSTGLCITAFYRCVLLLFIVHLLSRVSVLRVSEMFSHLHHPQCCVIRLCSRAVCALLGWEEIQGQLQQSREILQGQKFSCPLLAAPAFSIHYYMVNKRESFCPYTSGETLDSQKRVNVLEPLGTACLPLQSP